jgi:ABC-2 type transport system permease protein
MTGTLVRKLLRDVRWPLLAVCLLLFLFSTLWVRVAWRVTTEVAPFFNLIAKNSSIDQTAIEKVVFNGPGKVSQAVLGGADIRFERPTDFLAVEMLHPVVIILVTLWGVGRTGGAIAGEIDRGTMELLLSQPVPRDRLVLAHLIVDLLVTPLICLSILGGTQLGLWLTGPFIENHEVFNDLPPAARAIATAKPPAELPVDVGGQWKAALNLAGLIFAVSGVSLFVSSDGRSRWRALGWAILLVVVMFVVNVVGQLWEPIGRLRPLTLFFYYQPQNVWLKDVWMADVGEALGMAKGWVVVPSVVLLFAVGTAGYLAALRVFTKRDVPAPL